MKNLILTLLLFIKDGLPAKSILIKQTTELAISKLFLENLYLNLLITNQ